MNLTFENIVHLIDKGQYVSPNFLTKKAYVLVSNEKWTLDYLKYFEDFKKYLQNKINITFEIVGGGKSCSKMVVEFSGEDEAILNLLNIINTDTHTTGHF